MENKYGGNDMNIQSKLLTSYILLVLTSISVGSVFAVSSMFVDSVRFPKWISLKMFALIGMLSSLPFVIVSDYNINWRKLYKNICRIVSFSVLAESVIVLIQRRLDLFFFEGCVVGTFDNTAGIAACLGVSFPMGIMFYEEYGKAEKQFFLVTKILSLLVILSLGSRIGTVCMLFFILIVFLERKHLTKRIAFLFLVAVLPFAALCMKTSSTAGRFFILKNTVKMICDRPLFGWGHNGFAKEYMNVQADYFLANPDSKYVQVAGNIHHPLNEFFLLAVNYGLPCITMLFIFMIITYNYYRSHKSIHATEGMNILMCIGILASFSYPFSYPFTWFMLVSGIVLLFFSFIKKILGVRQIKIAYPFIWIGSLIAAIPISAEICSQIKWKRMSDVAGRQSYEKVAASYTQLYKERINDYHFLYDYACKEYDTRRYSTALKLSKDASDLIADYDIQLLLADTYTSMHQDSIAIENYMLVHNMCPSRLTPCYEIYEIYSNRNDTAHCLIWYDKIKKMHVKVKNGLTKAMLFEIEQDIRRFKKRPNY